MKKGIALGITLMPLTVAAGNFAVGTLSNVHFMGSGAVIAYTTGARTNVPACAAGQPQRIALDASTPAGKTQLAGLLTAYTSGKAIEIIGTGACSVWPDTETLSYLNIP